MNTIVNIVSVTVFLFVATFICPAQSDDTQNEKFSTVFPRQAYLHDIDELAKNLTDTHPQPYEFISKERYWRNVEAKKELITDSTTYGEFIWHASSIIASIGCGHTS
ncbi:MAG: hypothetical protein HKN25_15550, partial [Pyrinomonadaceae bacterium]|nr:hypothetical protein [Pyrinomonadaceae bacterium]